MKKEEYFLQDDTWQKEIEIINLYYKNLNRIKTNAKREEQNTLSLEEIERSLEENMGENSLELWQKDQARCEILLKDPEKIIRVKPMQYSPQDREEFDQQIKELIKVNLIRPSKSPHSSPAFMVRNHDEKLRKKPRMAINYKKLNSFTIRDGYFLPNKESLIREVQEKTIFIKFDCKSRYWQVKME